MLRLPFNFDSNTVLFRCSSLGYLMTDSREKSNLDKYNDAVEAVSKKQEQYANAKNKETKTALKLQEDITKLQFQVLELEKVKHEESLSETAKTHCVDVFVSNKYNRFTEFSSKECDKGNEVEEDSITIISRITGKLWKKNDLELRNDYIRGTCDLHDGEVQLISEDGLNCKIVKATQVRDAKSPWNAFTFFRSKFKDVKKLYYWQLLGYMWLTGARKASIDYCLNNTPYHLVERALKNESYNHFEGNTPAWIELQIIANHVYDIQTFNEYIQIRGCYAMEGDENAHAVCAGFVPIPLEERHFNFEFEYSEEDVESLKKRIILARQYISTLK